MSEYEKPSKFDRLPKTMAGVRDFNAGKGILLILIGAVLYVARSAFIPVVLALLAALVLSGPVEWLFRRSVPRAWSAVLMLVSGLAAVAGLIMILWGPSQQWYATAPQTLAVIQQRFTPVARLMSHIEALTNRAGKVATVGGAAPPPAGVIGPSAEGPRAALGAVGNYAVSLLTFVMLTLFLLTGGPPMVARMTAAFFDHLKANHVQRYIEKVRAEVGHYYVITAVINVGLGVATTFLMMAWGMPTPYLWGALAAFLNFIPYIGAASTLVLVTLVAVVSLNGLGHALGVALSDLALAAFEGQLIQPLLVGRRLEVNPLLIFLGLWFGGLFWGIAGVVLATPMLVALKVVAENALDGHSMMQFLGPNQPEPESAGVVKYLKGKRNAARP